MISRSLILPDEDRPRGFAIKRIRAKTSPLGAKTEWHRGAWGKKPRIVTFSDRDEAGRVAASLTELADNPHVRYAPAPFKGDPNA